MADVAAGAVKSPVDLRAAVIVTVSLTAFAVAAFAPQLFNDGDTYWHIRAGEWMLDHHAVLRRDPFSYTYSGAPWDTQEWFAEIVMALFYRWAHWSGLAALFAAAFAGTAFFLAQELSRWLRPLSLFVTLVLALGCVGVGMLARPHLLTLPLVVLWTRELLAARDENRAPSWRLLPVMVLWANLHASFLFGIALVVPFALEAVVETREKRADVVLAWGGFLVGAVVAGMLTPQGIYGLIFPLRLTGMSQIPFIREWHSTSFAKPVPLEFAMLAALYVFLSRGVRVGFFRLLVLLGLLHMALQHERQQTLLAICGALILARPMGAALDGGAPAHERALPTGALLSGLLGLIALTGLRLAVPTHHDDGPTTPHAAVAQVPPDVQRTPVFNDYALGGYLIFSGIRPFIDSRADLYGDDFVYAYRRMIVPDRALLDAAVRKYAIRWAILAPDNAANAYFSSAAGWRRRYGDKVAVVYLREK